MSKFSVGAPIDPGAAIIDPGAADLAYQDLLQAWLSARFGRDRGSEGLGRMPPLPELGEEDFFAELPRHSLSAIDYRSLRSEAMNVWREIAGVCSAS